MPYSDTQLLEHLSELADQLDHPPSTTEMDDEGRYSARTYINRFDRWPNALSLADVDTQDVGKQIPRRSLLNALRGLAETLGHPPRTSDIRSGTPHHIQTFKDRFGSLEDALEAADISSHNIGYTRTREELLDELQRLADELGHAPSTTDMKTRGEFVYATYLERFDSWENAIEAAGLPPETVQYRLTREELIAELEFLEEKLGKVPAKWDMSLHGRYSPAPYLLRWGKWADALEEAEMLPENAKRIPNHVLEADLRHVIATIHEEPTWDQLNEHSNFSPTTYYKRYGSIADAVTAATAPR